MRIRTGMVRALVKILKWRCRERRQGLNDCYRFGFAVSFSMPVLVLGQRMSGGKQL